MLVLLHAQKKGRKHLSPQAMHQRLQGILQSIVRGLCQQDTAGGHNPWYLRALHVGNGIAQHGALVVLCREPVHTLHTR